MHLECDPEISFDRQQGRVKSVGNLKHLKKIEMISKVILDKLIKNINQGVFEVLFKNLNILLRPEVSPEARTIPRALP